MISGGRSNDFSGQSTVSMTVDVDIGILNEAMKETNTNRLHYVSGMAPDRKTFMPRQGDIVVMDTGMKAYTLRKISVFSAFNRVIKKATNAERITDLPKRLVIIGVCLSSLPERDINVKEAKIAVAVGGTVYIRNTSKKRINASDEVIAVMPPDDPSAQVDRRFVFITEPYIPPKFEAQSVADVTNDIKSKANATYGYNQEFFRNIDGIYDILGTQTTPKFSDYLNAVISVYDNSRKNVIGKALTSAAPGEMFTLLLSISKNV